VLDGGPGDAPVQTVADAGGDAHRGLDCATDLASDGLAQHLACAGFYSDFASKTVAAELRPFTPGLTFWSDGAEKERFVSLPPGGTIDIANFDEWQFPVGTRFWKQFKVDGKLIETRLFMKTDGGWKRTAYRWNDDESDATRLDTGDHVALAGRTPYEVPPVDQCDFCHGGRVEPVLGFQALGLGVAGAVGLTLAQLASEGALSTAPPSTSLVIPDDATKLAAPAMGWLHANCGHCHNENPNAGAYGASLKMLIPASALVNNADAGVTSAQNLPAYRTGVCKPSERDGPGPGGKYLYFAGGSVNTSIAAILLGSRAEPGKESIVNQMPPIVTHMVDVAGQKLVDDWITALPTCP
jgi:hypothetical protein